MICPKCRNDSIPFEKIWLKGGLGTYRCPTCGAISRVKRSVPLAIASMSFGGIAAIVGFLLRSWLAFGITLAFGVILDALMDSRLRRLELIQTET
jgi:hypothetical protein